MLYNQKHFLRKKINLLRLIVIIGSVLLFAGGPDYYSPRSFKNIWDLGHILFFSILSYLILLSWSQNDRMPPVLQAFSILFIALILGVLIEIVQSGSRRSSDILDVIRNFIGCMVTFSFFAPSRKTIPKLFIRSFQTITVVLVIAALLPSIKSISDEIVALRQFPVLSDFETPFEIDRWSGNAKLSIDNDIHFHGGSSLKVFLKTSKYSGAGLRYFPGNWSNYKYLHLNIFNPINEPLKITCRIHDRRHTEGIQVYNDRFNRNQVLLKGWNQIVIPLDQVENAPKTRKLDLRKVQKLAVYVYRLPQPRVIYIDDVRLADRTDGK
jgi:VanZ family protein